ncbi:MAG: hypothetical protein CW716_12400 [Candidatus Bathyarchaeum sp.]|nr:MAG: hypothetical protein CW716_12400 [Candidatus Bathyarchaeum sp.]
MATTKKLVFIGILSLLVGTVFATPLLVAELEEIKPYKDPLPKGTTADVSVDVIYANFSIGDTWLHEDSNRNVTDITYFVVLNVTNNSDECAEVTSVEFTAAKNVTKGITGDSPFVSDKFTGYSGWEAEGAWVDGIWYNVTWVPHNNFWINCTSIIQGQDMWGEDSPEGEGYWMEGVQIMDKREGGILGTITSTYMNMNGTWVDVTGRINVTRPEEADPKDLVTVSEPLFSEMKCLIPGTSSGMENWVLDGITTNTDADFNKRWLAGESRLIAITNNRSILTSILSPSKLELVKTEPVSIKLRAHHRINGTLGIIDTYSFTTKIKSVQFETTPQGYLYNTVLSDDQMFMMDEFGAEVFIEPRN